MPKLTYLEAIKNALDLALEKDDQTFILGEDVGKKVAFLALLQVFKINMVCTVY